MLLKVGRAWSRVPREVGNARWLAPSQARLGLSLLTAQNELRLTLPYSAAHTNLCHRAHHGPWLLCPGHLFQGHHVLGRHLSSGPSSGTGLVPHGAGSDLQHTKENPSRISLQTKRPRQAMSWPAPGQALTSEWKSSSQQSSGPPASTHGSAGQTSLPHGQAPAPHGPTHQGPCGPAQPCLDVALPEALLQALLE